MSTTSDASWRMQVFTGHSSMGHAAIRFAGLRSGNASRSSPRLLAGECQLWRGRCVLGRSGKVNTVEARWAPGQDLAETTVTDSKSRLQLVELLPAHRSMS